jgi:hypothetical protein
MAERLLAQQHGSSQVWLRLVEFADQSERHAQGMSGNCFGARSIPESAVNLLLGRFQRLPHRDVDAQAAALPGRPGNPQHVIDKEVAERIRVCFGLPGGPLSFFRRHASHALAFGTLRLGLPRLLGAQQAHRCADNAAQERQHHQRRRHNCPPIPAQELL